VIGFDAGKQLFADRDPVGSEITLNGVPYTVIGKMRRKDQDSSYTGEDNERLFIPYEAARKDFPLSGSLTTANSISKIIATPFERVTEQLRRMTEAHGRNFLDSSGPVEFEVRTILGARHNFEPRDNEALPIWNTMLSSVMFSKMMNGISEFFIAVAVVTLGLGGIGVMNIMLIAVKERTREIGLRKALGATPRNIQWQFLSEGLLLTVLSGAIGLGLGLGLCKLVNLLPAPARFSGMIVTWQAAALSVVALALVGVVASTYPARRAAELPPIEALRFEM
jgi:putative ABC transport system permease protein